MKFEFNKKNILLLTILIIIMIVGLTLHDYRNPSNGVKVTKKITLVDDYSRFFTISNASNKYINYLQNRDKDNLMFLLSDSYIVGNNINKNNILTKLKLLDEGEYNFEARNMYQEKFSKNIIRYYIKGNLTRIMIDQYTKPIDYYLIVDLYLDNSTFSVIPYDGKMFKEAK